MKYTRRLFRPRTPRGILVAAASEATRLRVSIIQPKNSWVVAAYPKSGASWFARMLAEYLELEFPQDSMLPIGADSVIQNHWGPVRRVQQAFYVVRDGRDVVVSLLFARLRNDADGVEASELGGRTDSDAVREYLPRFIESEIHNPRWSYGLNWSDHIEAWKAIDSSSVTFVAYEQLLSDTALAMGKALSERGITLDRNRLNRVVASNTFEQMSGRPRGEQSFTSYFRKGIDGDWRNYFTRRAAEVFHDFAGKQLLELGYETSSDWVTLIK